jgi:NAD(P)-dependent dehydrogenase (short-subunit alcohol dehydrogenase family)
MNLKRKIVLVTGSTDGVGRLVARQLADQGARVLIHGRNRDRGKELVEQIRAARGSAVFLPADFSSLDEVRRLADVVRQECDRLDLLINNAGIGSGGSAGKRETSQDGYELRFAVNYLAGFLLMRLLLPIMMLNKPDRVVSVSSLGQHPIDFDDVMLTGGYSGQRALANSPRSCSRSILRASSIRRRSRRIAYIRPLTWQQRWYGRAETPRSAPWRKEHKQSSTWPCRKSSMVIPASFTMG